MCQPAEDTFGFLKQQVALANKEYKASQMRLLLNNTILNDDDKIEKYEDEIKNESELHVVFQISDGEWEAVTIADTQGGFGGEAS